jgi:hypothetical protein
VKHNSFLQHYTSTGEARILDSHRHVVGITKVRVCVWFGGVGVGVGGNELPRYPYVCLLLTKTWPASKAQRGST